MDTLTRRRFSTLLAGTAAAVAGCSSLGRPYERVVDMVADAGCDPSGTEPCQDAIRRVAADDTLLRFPTGTFLISEPTVIDDVDRLGIVGTGRTRLRAAEGFGGKLLNLQVGELSFQDVDIDLEAPNTTAGLRIVADRGFRLENVEFHGRGTHTDPETVSALSPSVTSPDGVGIVKDLVARQGSAWAHYRGGSGRGGIHVGGDHEGTLRVIDCHLAEFGNNGIYGNDTPGNVQVEGGVYRNNNVAGIRIGGAGSYVDGALVEVDPARYTGPRTEEGYSFNMRGIILAQKPEKWGWKDAGVEIRNCDIRIAENPSGSSAAIHAWHTARTVSVCDTTIRMDEDNPAIRRAPQDDTLRRPSSTGERWVRCENVTVEGRAVGTPVFQFQNADDSRVTDCRISAPGAGCDGILFEACRGCLVDDGSIVTTRYPVYVRARGRLPGNDDCILTFAHGPRLETDDRRLAAIQDDDKSTRRLASKGWFSSERCLDGRTLSAVARPSGVEGAPERDANVAVTGSNGRELVVASVEPIHR